MAYNLDQYAAISTIIIALCALFVSIWQGYITRKHARLSVEPILGIHFSITQTSKFTGISIENNGLGAARINQITITKINRGRKELVIRNHAGWANFLPSFELRNGHVTYSSIGPGEAIPANTTHELIKIADTDPEKGAMRAELRKMLDTFSIELEYESMYGVRKKLKWPKQP